MARKEETREMTAPMSCIIYVCDECGREAVAIDDRKSRLSWGNLLDGWISWADSGQRDILFCGWWCVIAYAQKQIKTPVLSCGCAAGSQHGHVGSKTISLG